MNSELCSSFIRQTDDYGIFALNLKGRAISWNRGVKKILGYDERDFADLPFEKLFTPDDLEAGVPEAELREAVATGRASDDRWSVRCDGSWIWVNGVTTAMRDDGGRTVGFVKIIQDRTRQKELEERLAAQSDVGRILTDASSLQEALPQILRSVCEAMGWGWGAVWKVHPTSRTMRCTDLWRPPGRYEEFERVTRQLCFDEDRSLPGRVLARNKPLWIPDIAADPEFVRADAGKRAGLRSAYGFPVRIGGEFLGVMEFISPRVREPDPSMLAMMTAIGTQIGQFIERHRAAEALENHLRLMLAMTNSLGEGVYAVDAEGRGTFVNPAAERILGWTEQELRGRDMHQTIHTPHTDTNESSSQSCPLLAVMSSEQTVHCDEDLFVRKGGESVSVEYTSAPLRQDGRVLGAVVIFRDITQSKKAQQELRESEERFHELVRNVDSVLWIADLKAQRALYISPVYEKLWGRSREELYSDFKAWMRAVHAADRPRVARAIDELHNGGGYDIEYRIARPDGTERWIRDRGNPIRDEWGEMSRVAGIAEDITDRRRAADALREAKAAAEAANTAKDRFLAILSHELRTPLTPVLAIASMHESDPRLPEEVREDLHIVRRNAELEARLIDDLLDVTQIVRGKIRLNMHTVDVHDLIAHVVRILREDLDTKQLDLRLRLDASSRHVRGDPVRLQQVLWNLLKNAIKFTPEGGQITVRSNDEPHTLVIEVSDNGIGIDPRMLPNIFDAFSQIDSSMTRRFGGLGLGLTISRKLVELQGGELHADSAGPGKGSTFTARLPLTTRAIPSETGADGADELKAAPGLRILLIEDHADTLRTLKRLLEGMGCVVRATSTASEALDLAATETFDLVISDLGLPDISGLELMTQLKARHNLKGIALSGYGMDEDRSRSRQAGFEEHLIKPIDFARLASLVHDWRSMKPAQ